MYAFSCKDCVSHKSFFNFILDPKKLLYHEIKAGVLSLCLAKPT